MKSWRCVKEINFWAWFEGWVFSIAFVPIVFIDDNALCMVLNYVHCPALLLPCLSVCYGNEMDLDQVPSLWWNNLCRWVVRSEPGGVDQYSSYCSVFQASSFKPSMFKLKAVFRYTRAVSNTSRSLLYVVELSYFITWNLTLRILTEETVYCFCGNKPVHGCCCFELFYRLELDFLGLLERYVIICFCFFICNNCGNDTFCIANSWLILKFDHGWIWLSLIDIIDIVRCLF